VFDLPAKPVPVFMAAGGPQAATQAAQCGLGLCNTEPNPKVIEAYKQHGGNGNDTWNQIVLSWNEDEKKAKQTAYDMFRFSAGGWKVQAELPNPINFDASVKQVSPDDIAESIPCGPDVSKHVKGVRSLTDIGYKNIAVAYPGTDTDGFMEFWKHKLRPSLQ
jgi:G6PDH family F420-dependent oxidoreductase